jgi:urease accessory protein
MSPSSIGEAMRRVSAIRPANTWNADEAIDRIVLDAEDRHRRRLALVAEKGTRFLLDLPHPTALRDGDGLVLDDGSIVRVEGRREPLIEISATGAADLARIAWHIGNRHIQMQVMGDKLRVRRDHVLEEVLRGLGAHVEPVEAPFDPMGAGSLDHRHE